MDTPPNNSIKDIPEEKNTHSPFRKKFKHQL
jgi:hypothetical protein